MTTPTTPEAAKLAGQSITMPPMAKADRIAGGARSTKSASAGKTTAAGVAQAGLDRPISAKGKLPVLIARPLSQHALADGWEAPARLPLHVRLAARRQHCNQHIVSRARRTLLHLHALPAAHIPAVEDVQAAIGIDRLSCYAAILSSRPTRDHWRAITTQLTPPAISLKVLQDKPNVLDNELHDSYFGVVRVAPGDFVAHVEAIVLAAQILLREMRTGSDKFGMGDFRALAQGIELAFELATGIRPEPIALLPAVPAANSSAFAISRRWMRGHQMFLVITQAMIACVNHLEALLTDPHSGDQQSHRIDQLIVLLQAAAAAMRLTGDFPPEVYDTIIRPSMAPPFMPDGFSGIFSSDHRFLVMRLRDISPHMAGLKERLGEAHGALVASFSALYDDHREVCANFVSSDKNSLLMADGARCTALDQLAKFKKSRLRLIGK